MTAKRYRCSKCEQIIEAKKLVETPIQPLVEKMRELHPDLFISDARADPLFYHRKSSFYRGRTNMFDCGPVKVEEISDYQDCFEHFFGETL